jgi:uncharacterized protein HemX
MINGMALAAAGMMLAALALSPGVTRAQDVPGIEICTVEKTMERRTSCLQSNVEFLQKTITKRAADQQQRLDAANRQIEGLKSALASLQKVVNDLQIAGAKAPDDQARKATPVTPKALPAKEGGN